MMMVNISMQLKKNNRSLVFRCLLYGREVIVMPWSIWIYCFYFIESIQWGQCYAFVKRGDRYRLDICKKNHIKHNKYIHVTIFYFYLCFARIVIVDSIDLT